MTGRENGVTSIECTGTRALNLMSYSTMAQKRRSRVGEEINEARLQTKSGGCFPVCTLQDVRGEFKHLKVFVGKGKNKVVCSSS